jgi:hypothetical protein
MVFNGVGALTDATVIGVQSEAAAVDSGSVERERITHDPISPFGASVRARISQGRPRASRRARDGERGDEPADPDEHPHGGASGAGRKGLSDDVGAGVPEDGVRERTE